MTPHHEEAVIALLLRTPAQALSVDLSPNHFQDDQLADVFGMMQASAPQFDAVSLSQELSAGRSAGQLMSRLGELQRNAPANAAALKRHVDAVQKNAKRVHIRVALQEGIDHLNHDTPEQVVERTLQKLVADAGHTNDHACDARDLMRETIAHIDDIQQASQSGKPVGVATGIKALDKRLGGLHDGDLVTIAGRPKMGKTALLANIALNAAAAGHAIGIFSAEMNRTELGMRLCALQSGVPLANLRNGNLTEPEWSALTQATAQLGDLSLRVNDTPACRVGTVVRQAYAWSMRGLDLLLIDYLTRLQPDRDTGNRVQDVGQMAQAFKTLARDLEIPVVLAAQLSRAVEARQDKRPVMSDLRDSGMVEQESDQVLMLYRDAVYNQSADPRAGEIHIVANRHGETGFFDVDFDAPVMRWKDRV